MNRLRKHLHDSTGSLYIEILVCFLIFVVALVFCVQMSSVFIEKQWIDDKLEDLTRVIAVDGAIMSDDIDVIVNQMTERFPNCTIEYDITDDSLSQYNPTTGAIQLGNTVTVTFICNDYPVITLGGSGFGEDSIMMNVPIDIHISRLAISEVYHKEFDEAG